MIVNYLAKPRSPIVGQGVELLAGACALLAAVVVAPVVVGRMLVVVGRLHDQPQTRRAYHATVNFHLPTDFW
ncbi:MAG TPA: hypothetical protein VND64_17995 [Pirellulales bacterium]|nr:hypothetical protein [Pirellulales bacterium]